MNVKLFCLMILFYSSFSVSREFETQYSDSEVCNEIRDAMSSALRKDMHPLSGLKTNLGVEGGMLEFDEAPELNRLSKKRQHKVVYYVLDVDQDGEDEVLIRTDVALERGMASHRQYYFLQGLEKIDRKSIKDQLSNVLWINAKGLALPSIIKYPVLFDLGGDESGTGDVSFDSAYPFIFLVGDRFYIYIAKARYVGVLSLVGINDVRPSCLYYW